MSDPSNRPNNPDLLVQTSLASVSVQALLYGIFFSLFCLSTYLLVQWHYHAPGGRRESRSIWRKTPFIAGIALFVTLTVNEFTYIWRSFEAFESPLGSHTFYGDVTQKSYFVQTATTLVTLIISDAMMVYRLWVVWNFNYRVSLAPGIIWLAGVGLCGAMMWQLVSYQPASPVDGPDRTIFIIGVFVDTAVTNFYCSGLIGWKLFRLSRMTHGRTFGSRTVSWYLSTLIEMVALYVGITVIFFVVYLTHSNTASLFECMIAPIAGIAFMFINVRVGLGYSPQSTYYSRTLAASYSSPRSEWNTSTQIVELVPMHVLSQNGSTTTNLGEKANASLPASVCKDAVMPAG